MSKNSNRGAIAVKLSRIFNGSLLRQPALQLIYDTAPIGLAVLSLDCRYLQLNQRLTKMTIENCGNSADKLLSASTPIAGRAAIHEMLDKDGVMKMRPMNGGLVIPPNGKLTLAPGGSHLMFVELRSPLVEGKQVPVSLEFEKAGQINISLQVTGMGAKDPQPSATS